jgi:predicted TIM-barrel fold metal-dependent hydrolase
MFKYALPFLLAINFGCAQSKSDEVETPAPQPIIDAHLHAGMAYEDDAEELDKILKRMDAHNIKLAVLHITSEDDVDIWAKKHPSKFIAGPMLPCPPISETNLFCFPESDGWPDLTWLETGFKSGALGSIGELLLNYAGLPAGAPELEPYWRLAAEYDIPVFVHINAGPAVGQGPRQSDACCPDYDPSVGNPALLRPVLERHPNLRISLQHAGLTDMSMGDFDFWDETLALMRDYPNVYADMTILNSVFPEPIYHAALQRFISEGFIDRIMFGTDNMPVELGVARLNAIDFLTEEQRRGIFYDNAARFLRIDEKSRDAHYGR